MWRWHQSRGIVHSQSTAAGDSVVIIGTTSNNHHHSITTCIQCMAYHAACNMLQQSDMSDTNTHTHTHTHTHTLQCVALVQIAMQSLQCLATKTTAALSHHQHDTSLSSLATQCCIASLRTKIQSPETCEVSRSTSRSCITLTYTCSSSIDNRLRLCHVAIGKSMHCAVSQSPTDQHQWPCIAGCHAIRVATV
jgi:hypothetical protein